MLIKSYSKEISRPKCNSSFQVVHCLVHLETDIGEVLPYLNAALGGHQYTKDPPSVTLRHQGKLITIHSRMIAINALKDADEAEHVAQWLCGEINEIWERRSEITPRFEGPSRPGVLEVLRLLPRTNCGECGQATCMLFAVLAAEGAKGAGDCPPLEEPARTRLESYLGAFSFDS